MDKDLIKKRYIKKINLLNYVQNIQKKIDQLQDCLKEEIY